ncbi:hypothetical protein DPMN_011585 [Dreissena polymorpha]|uniref:Uncharacterized protein n=1 Tax=Dreissena polymorpha TaxID=45954 RepID=A0A9D4N0V0_DREPO|nr:hypothetical protein DPMN_011585 [Dreissena polymorpha]
MRDHIPADRVPFYCTLCNCRCQEAATHKSHIQRFTCHQREEVMADEKHYLTWLKKTEYPIFVCEQHVQASPSVSSMWYRSDRPTARSCRLQHPRPYRSN